MSKTLSKNSSLLAAFTLPPVNKTQEKKQQQQGQQQQQKQLKNAHSSSSVCSSSGSENGDHEQQQQQAFFETVSVSVSPYLTFTQDIQGPTFIPVFASVESILPHPNASFKGQVPWKCSNCNSSAHGHKCNVCHRSRDAAAIRVFLGQLSKEGDVELVYKMVEVLCPEIDITKSILHIEPHTSAATARGKGCAWAYVDSIESLLYICKRLHKRTYPTVNTQTGEVGFVAFPDSYTEAQIKAAFDNDMSFLPESVFALFHRSPITAEVPKTLQRSLNLPQQITLNNNNNNSAAPTTVNSRPAPQYHQQHNFMQQQQTVAVAAAPRQQQPVVFEQEQQQQMMMMKPSAYAPPTRKQQQQQQEEQQHYHQEEAQTTATTPSKQQQQKKLLTRYHWNPYSPSSVRTHCA